MHELNNSAWLNLCIKFLKRSLHASELKILIASVFIGVATATTIIYFTDKLYASMQSKASEFLASDMVLQGSTLPSDNQVGLAKALGLNIAQTIEFASMAATDTKTQLASVKAVTENYPLKGNIKSITELNSGVELENNELETKVPKLDHAWVEPSLSSMLNITIGDKIDIGAKTFIVERFMVSEPDRSNNFYSFAPRVMINIQDLDATKTIAKASRFSHRLLLTGSSYALTEFEKQVDASPSQRIRKLDDQNQQTSNALTRAEKYFNLTSLAAMILSCVAIALAASAYVRSNFDNSALLRSLGLTRMRVVGLFVVQLLIIGFLTAIVAVICGYIFQYVLFVILAGILPNNLPSVGIAPAIIGVVIGIIAIVGFALPPLVALKDIPPARVLRRDMDVVNIKNGFIYLVAVICLFIMMFFMAPNIGLNLSMFATIAMICIVVGVLFAGLVKFLDKIIPKDVAWRIGFGQLLKTPVNAFGQTVAFTIILFIMSLVFLLRVELLDQWKAGLNDDTPNHFIINITPETKDKFADALAKLQVKFNGKTATNIEYYPIVSGRLTYINEQPTSTLSENKSHESLKRDLQISWTLNLPDGNEITEGTWFSNGVSGVSIEESLATRIDVKLGDILTINIAGTNIKAPVTSIRKVAWQNFRPNFFVILHPEIVANIVDNKQYTYMTAFNLQNKDGSALVELSTGAPSITIIPLESVIAQIQDIISQASLAIEYVLLFILVTGIIVLIAGLQSTLKDRIKQGALLKTLGASHKLLLKIRIIEFGILGGLSGLFAWLVCEIATAIIYVKLLDIDFSLHPYLVILPILGAILISTIGVLRTRQSLTVEPMVILKEL